MSNSWFRLYHEFATDPKIQMLSESDQRRFIMLLCHRCNGHVTLQDEEVTFLLRISNEEWMATKSIFIEKGFINKDNKILNWDKRQFVSDSSAERVARHRKRMKQQCNVTVTPPDTDTDTDTDKKKNIKKENSTFDQFWKEYPKKSGKHVALKAWIKKKPPIDAVLNALNWQKTSRQWSEGFVPNPATYINQGRWEDEPEKINVMPLPRGSPSFKTQQAEINARSIFGVNHERDITEESREFENRKIT